MPGNALSVAPGSPFAELQRFGNALLGRFVGSMVHSPVLRHLTLVDTPGVLSGKEEQLQRGFDFAQAVRWCARSARRRARSARGPRVGDGAQVAVFLSRSLPLSLPPSLSRAPSRGTGS